MKRIDSIEPFRVMQLLERAKQLEQEGQSIVHMEIGEPDFPSPALAVEAAERALHKGKTYYTPSTGLPQLRERLASWYEWKYGVSIDAERIIITPGTSAAFLTLYLVLLEPGDDVLLPDPGYPCQRNFIRLAGGTPRCIPVGAETAFHLNPEALITHWGKNTRAAVVISPGNPTGTIVPEEDLRKLANVCRDLGGWLISDEIYHGLTYGCEAACALSFDEDCIVVNGFSKRWAMTGWRVGWMIVPETLVDACRRVIQNIFIAAPTISQYAAIAALDAEEEVEAMRRQFDERRRFLLASLKELGFVIPVEPKGAFYIYADVSPFTHDSTTFCWRLLEEEGVAVTPGEDFGHHQAATHVRFSYATDMKSLAEGVERIRRFLCRIRKEC